MRRELVTVMLIAIAGAVTGCGDDDGGSTDPTASATTITVGAVQDFCTAEVDVEAALAAEDEARVEEAATRLIATAPPEIADAVETAIAEQEATAVNDPPSDAFTAAYGEMIAFMSARCGYHQLDVLAEDYTFGGIGPRLDAGPTIVDIVNRGDEVHEVVLLRKNPGVTESFDEILALGEEGAAELAEFVNSGAAMPGETGHLVADLTPGDYLAICFIAKGTTPEAVDRVMDEGAAMPDGPPHFVEGMLHEFVVD